MTTSPDALANLDLAHRRVVVTGAAGFIGSHLTEHLLDLGCEVTALVRYNSAGNRGWLDDAIRARRPKLTIVAGDVTDPFIVDQAVAGADVVFHLAALIAIPYSYVAPKAYVDTNVLGTVNVLEAVRRHRVAKLVHTSTSEVYGTARYVPIDEDHPLQGQSPYSATKIGADQLALSYHRSFGVPVAVCRPFNTYGPRQSARAVLPTIILQLAQGATEVQLGSLGPTRDFNFVADTVRGFVAVARSPRSIGEVINIGSGFEVTVGRAGELIAEEMGTTIRYREDERRLRPAQSEVERLLCANGKAQRLLGWSPAIAGEDGLRAGLRATIAWFRDPANRARYDATVYSI